MPPATIRVLPLADVWQVVGQGVLAGVGHEGLSYSHDHWGSSTCQFALRREPGAQYPDLTAWTPCIIEKLGVPAWVGRVKETPTQEGSDAVVNVTGSGMQYHLDDDLDQRGYVMAGMSQWKDVRAFAGAPLGLGSGKFPAYGQVSVDDRAVTLMVPNATAVLQFEDVGVTLDLGAFSTYPTRISLDWKSSNNSSTFAMFVFTSPTEDPQGTGTSNPGSIVFNTGASGTTSYTITSPQRYVSLVIQRQGAPATTSADLWMKFTGIRLYWDADYESGNQSILRASDVVKDVVQMAPLLRQSSAPQTFSSARSAGTGADDAAVGAVAWSAPGNITASDGANANATPGASHYLKATNFGFTIPAGAVISGIQVLVLRWVGSKVTVDNNLRLVKAGVIQTPNQADAVTAWPNTPHYKFYGGPADLWSGTWAPSDINSSGFGMALSAQVAAGANTDAHVDYVRIVVYYTLSVAQVDTSGVDPAGQDAFAIDDFALDGTHTAREFWEAVNAYNAWVTKVDEDSRPVFKQLPSVPALAIGEWSGADFVDSSANSGDEIYNKAVAEATGPDGAPLRTTRYAAQQDGVVPRTPPGIVVDNPSFDVNAASWTATGTGTIVRDTTAGEFDSAPAGGLWTGGTGFVLTTTFTGTFEQGSFYVLTFRAASGSAGGLVVWNALLGVPGTGAHQSNRGVNDVNNQLDMPDPAPGPQFRTQVITWVPDVDSTGVALTITANLGQQSFFDSLVLTVLAPTLPDKRHFVRATSLPLSSAVSAAGGQRITDTYLSQHMTTPSKGSATAVPGGVRGALDGRDVHPGHLGKYTTELVRLSHRIDPDTGAIGRNVRVASVDYDDTTEQASVSFDNTRSNFEALLARYAVISGAGR